MAKGLNHYIKQAWKKPSKEILRPRMVEWRRSDAIVKVERPLRLDRARALGYRAKPGFIVVRVRLMRGGRRSPVKNHGRRSKRKTNLKILKMNYQGVAEQRVARRYNNMEVLNSYWIGQDGIYGFYEVILVDPCHPQIRSDQKINWVCDRANRGRAFRGLTSAGRKSRGLRAVGRNQKF